VQALGNLATDEHGGNTDCLPGPGSRRASIRGHPCCSVAHVGRQVLGVSSPPESDSRIEVSAITFCIRR